MWWTPFLWFGHFQRWRFWVLGPHGFKLDVGSLDRRWELGIENHDMGSHDLREAFFFFFEIQQHRLGTKCLRLL